MTGEKFMGLSGISLNLAFISFQSRILSNFWMTILIFVYVDSCAVCRNPSMEFGGTEQNSCAEVSYKNASLANGNNLK